MIFKFVICNKMKQKRHLGIKTSEEITKQKKQQQPLTRSEVISELQKQTQLTDIYIFSVKWQYSRCANQKWRQKNRMALSECKRLETCSL